MITETKDPIIGESAAFFELMDRVSQAAPLNRPVLVVGERGTGKEVIASRLHFLSTRWNKPYQKMNCAALTETLLESELFGYEPGAFTGAAKRRAGRFEAAHGGTLFLDEIGTMSLAAQEKLLRVIEYGEFERVGGTETINVDVRVIGATNIDLPTAAENGTFRHDLLDRLAFDVLTVPPLRTRQEDIMPLADHFASRMARELEWLVYPGFSKAATVKLLGYSWPGNVRELKNVAERAVYSSWDGEAPIETVVFDPFESPYRPELLPASNNTSAGQAPTPEIDRLQKPFNAREEIAAFERSLLSQSLDQHKYNQKATAKHMGLSYDQLRHMMKKHHML